MSTDRYVETKEELTRFYKSARAMTGTLNSLFQQGVERLDYGMNEWKNVDKKPSFDATTKPPPYSYGEKNYYINASNNMWYIYLWKGMRVPPAINELYYTALLNRIEEFRRNNNGFDFNKGIVYANLGVAQSAQMKLDEGFANILKALIEDYPYSDINPESNIWKNPLFTQFERQYVRIPLHTIISGFNMAEIASIESFIENFLNSLNNDQRAFFEYTFTRIKQNEKIWSERENSLTANRLLAYTQDFCLFNEDFLKSKFSRADLSNLRRKELGYLIPAKFDVSTSDCSASEISELDNMLPSEMQKQNLKERCLRILLMLRNYSSHNIGGGTNANYLYAEYDEILNELIRATCHIALLPKPP